MKFEIKNRFSGEVSVVLRGDNFKLAFEAAVKLGTKFDSCAFDGFDFSGVVCAGARFDNSSFDNSRFYNSRFDNSSFYNSRFYNSRFDNSSFDNSRFDNSSFYNSSFYNSRFDNSRFDNSSFDNSRFDKDSFKGIPEMWLTQCRDDLWAILCTAPNEVAGLRKALVDGKVNGKVYEGSCACLVGTIANVRGCHFQKLDSLKPNSSRPAECWFIAICEGDTPEKNAFCKKAVEWIDEWEKSLAQAFDRRAIAL